MTDYTVGDTLHIAFTTRAFATGIPTVLAGTPVVSAYEDASLTQITAGITLGVDHDSVVGLNMLTIVATGGNGYESGKDYHMVVTTGTVGGVSVVGEVVGRFTLGRSAAAVDLANGTDGLGAIKTDTAAVLVDTADMQPKLGAPAGASMSADIAVIEAQTDDIGVAGAGLTDITLNAASIDLVWDEVLTGGTHNVSNSSGRRLRVLEESGFYQDGLVWLDTVRGTSATTNFENGTNSLPVLTVANVNTLLAALPLHGCHVAAGSSVTFAAAQENQEWTGEDWTLALGGQSIAGTAVIDATVSGISTGVPTTFRSCFLNSCTFAGGDFIDCAIAGTITLSGASGTEYFFVTCHHAGTAAIIDFGTTAAVNTTVHVHGYIGAITVKNMGQAGTDVLHFDSPGGVLILDSTNIGGTVNLNGTLRFDDTSSGMTINRGGAIVQTVGLAVGATISADIAAVKSDTGPILTDTGELQTDWTNGGRLDLILDAVLAMLDDPRTEPGQGAPPVNPDAMTKLDYLYKSWRNKKDNDGTTTQLYADDTTTVDQKQTTSEAAGTVTKAEWATGP